MIEKLYGYTYMWEEGGGGVYGNGHATQGGGWTKYIEIYDNRREEGRDGCEVLSLCHY